MAAAEVSFDALADSVSVAWARELPGGSGAAIAESILGLLSADETERNNSYFTLENYLLPQGVLDEASYHALPFLLKLVRDRVALGYIYELLVYMTISAQPGAHDKGIQINGEAQSLTSACLARIVDGLDLYLRDLQDRELPKDCRFGALSIMCRLCEHRTTWLPVVQQVYETEQDPELRSDIGEWLSD